jgi:hypothetical protein
MHDRFVPDNLMSSRYLLYWVLVSWIDDDDAQAVSAVMRCRGCFID